MPINPNNQDPRPLASGDTPGVYGADLRSTGATAGSDKAARDASMIDQTVGDDLEAASGEDHQKKAVQGEKPGSDDRTMDRTSGTTDRGTA